MEVESVAESGEFQLSSVESALFFESPQEIYARVFRQIRPRTAMPAVEVNFCAFANANSSIRLTGNKLVVQIADVLEGAPGPVAEALAFILVSKLFRRQPAPAYLHRYRLWLNRKDVRQKIHLIRQLRGRKHLVHPQGKHVNLEDLFEALNREFFDGLMARPALGWSHRLSRTRLGHYDPSHNAIVLSRLLDGADIPPVVVEYVMFHEMLHLRHPEEHSGARRRIHTAAFKAAERQFPRLKEAKLELRKLVARAD